MSHPRPFRFGVLASKARSSSEWTETARKAESLGYSTLVMPDHFGDQLSPIAALSTAAAVTDTLRVGSLVFANDFRHPAVLAKETATLDLLSDGRLEVGVGAGWMTKDYTWTGMTQDRAGVRIDRMIEAISVLRGLWGDDAFSFDGEHYVITEMNGMPKPVQTGGPPIVVGGGSKRVLSTAARLADIVGVNPNVGEGKFGAEAIASMSADATDEKLGWVRAGAGDRFDDIEISILKFFTVVTDDRDTVAAEARRFDGHGRVDLAGEPALAGRFTRTARRRTRRTTRTVAGVVRHRAVRRVRGVRAGRRRTRREPERCRSTSQASEPW